jgi:hypothetical protein
MFHQFAQLGFYGCCGGWYGWLGGWVRTLVLVQDWSVAGRAERGNGGLVFLGGSKWVTTGTGVRAVVRAVVRAGVRIERVPVKVGS